MLLGKSLRIRHSIPEIPFLLRARRAATGPIDLGIAIAAAAAATEEEGKVPSLHLRSSLRFCSEALTLVAIDLGACSDRHGDGGDGGGNHCRRPPPSRSRRSRRLRGEGARGGGVVGHQIGGGCVHRRLRRRDF